MKATEEENKILELLLQFGLSKDEAGVFILLSRLKKDGARWLKGSEIRELAEKGRVRTYQILQALLQLGLVKVDFSRPKKYSAVSPQVALRRLISVHETKLTELSHLEKSAIESLLSLRPIEVPPEEEAHGLESTVSVLQGLANTQAALREAMEGADLLAVINQESADQILNAIEYLSDKPKSARIVYANPKKRPLKSYLSTAKQNEIALLWFKGSSPTFLVTKGQAMFLFYVMEKRRRKPLSPLTVSAKVSQAAIVKSDSYADQISGLFELLWRSSIRFG